MRFVGELVANDKLTVDEAAAEMDRRADHILEKRRWMLDHHTASAGASGAAK
jgi:multiple sugar transport system substrate-binding protein